MKNKSFIDSISDSLLLFVAQDKKNKDKIRMLLTKHKNEKIFLILDLRFAIMPIKKCIFIQI